jgi:hypothetical protein
MSAPLLITSDSRNSLEWHQKTSIPALDDLDPVAETAESEPEEKPKPTKKLRRTAKKSGVGRTDSVGH